MNKTGLFFAILIFLPLVSSQIIFLDTPKKVYNIDDSINLDFSIKEEVFTRGDVQTFLVCGNDERLIFQQFNEFRNNQAKNFSLFSLASMEGECFVKVLFNSEEEKTQDFKITDEIFVEANLNNKFFLPKEELKINGTAKKANSEDLNGIAVISIENLISQTVEVREGKFNFEYAFEDDVAPGDYIVKISAIDKNFNGVQINLGNFSEEIEIKSYPTRIKIDSPESFKPSYTLDTKISLLDQTGIRFQGETLIIKVFNPENDIFFQTAKSSGENFTIFFPDNTMRGGWKLNAYYGDLFFSKPFYVEANKKININLSNENCKTNLSFCELNITNVGNVDYSGVIDVFINKENSKETLSLNINLSKGDSENFDLKNALTGEGLYNLSVEGQVFENVPLSPITGFAIFSNSKPNKGFFLWIFIILLILAGAFFIIRNFRKKNYRFNFEFLKKLSFKKLLQKKNISQDDFPKEEIKEQIQKSEVKKISDLQLPKTQSSVQEIKKPVEASKPIITKNEQIPEVKKRIYSVFFHDANFDALEEFLDKYNLVLHRTSGDLAFAITYSREDLSLDLVEMAKEIRKEFKGISMIIHSELFENKISSISSALLTKSLVSHLDGFFITEQIAESIKKSHKFAVHEDKCFKVKERIIKLYSVYKR